MKMWRFHIVLILAILCANALAYADDFDEEPIRYSQSAPDNALSRLQLALAQKKLTLEYDPQFGYLKSLLTLLNIPIESQTLVFTKTSFQNQYISPATPRAIYFNDDVYVGTVPNGDVIEIAVSDPNLGSVFYTVNQHGNQSPDFIRQSQNCLQCHASSMTQNVPGLLLRSVYPNAEGFPILNAGTFSTTQASPFKERWGGWYVTGTHGTIRHMGNAIATENEKNAVLDLETGANLINLESRIDTADYLSPHSDIVALMVLEHQTRMHNLFTQANYECRMALYRQADADKMLNRDPNTLSDSTKSIIRNIGNKVVDHLLFVDEVEFKSPIQGTSDFTQTFSLRGPADSTGKSLREFDLDTRLFEYPLSFLIYSPQFDALPQPMKDYIYQRLWDILTCAINTPEYQHLTNYKCRVIRQILLETKPGLPEYWH